MSFVDAYWRDPSNGLSPPDHKYCSPDWTALGFYNNWSVYTKTKNSLILDAAVDSAALSETDFHAS